jgi:hypothetical protein
MLKNHHDDLRRSSLVPYYVSIRCSLRLNNVFLNIHINIIFPFVVRSFKQLIVRQPCFVFSDLVVLKYYATRKLKVTLYLCLINRAPFHEELWRSECRGPPFSISALDGAELSTSHPGRFTPWERSVSTHCKEAGWVPEPVWTLLTCTCTCLGSNPGRPAHSLPLYPLSCH